jgi:hypothetical protein
MSTAEDPATFATDIGERMLRQPVGEINTGIPADVPQSPFGSASPLAAGPLPAAGPEMSRSPSPEDTPVPSEEPLGYILALGRIVPRFPSLGVEKEFAQATGRADTAGLSDRQALQSVLSDRSNRYLARQLAWVFTIEGQDTYLLLPRDPSDVDLLIESVRPTPRATDIDVIIGVRGPLAPPEYANGLVLPFAMVDQIFSFDVDSLIQHIPRPEGRTSEEFEPAAEDLFNRIIQIADNAGATDEHRALNYLAVRYPAIYHRAAEAFDQNATLAAVRVIPSRLSGVRKISDVVFTWRHRETTVEESVFVRVDHTEEFPFLVSGLAPYFERL